MKSKKTEKQEEAVNAWSFNDPEIPSDVLGSYTGTPINGAPDANERPIQDADDL